MRPLEPAIAATGAGGEEIRSHVKAVKKEINIHAGETLNFRWGVQKKV